MNLLRLFRALQKQQRGMAIVLDEFGGTAGIVTMEDILAELVGQHRAPVAPEGFVMARLAPMSQIETMGGLLTHLLGVVPDAEESATFSGLKLTAQVTDGRRVKELIVQKVK